MQISPTLFHGVGQSILAEPRMYIMAAMTVLYRTRTKYASILSELSFQHGLGSTTNVCPSGLVLVSKICKDGS